MPFENIEKGDEGDGDAKLGPRQCAHESDGPNMQASAQHIWLPELMQSWSRNDKFGTFPP